MVEQEPQAGAVGLLVLLRAMLCAMLRTRRRLNTTEPRRQRACSALRRLPTIASALGHQKERFPDHVSTRSDVDACSRASRARRITRASKFYGNYLYYRLVSYYRSTRLASSYALTTYRSFLLSLLLKLGIDPALQALYSLKSTLRRLQNRRIHSQCKEPPAGRSKWAPIQIDHCIYEIIDLSRGRCNNQHTTGGVFPIYFYCKSIRCK